MADRERVHDRVFPVHTKPAGCEHVDTLILKSLDERHIPVEVGGKGQVEVPIRGHPYQKDTIR